MSFFLAWKGPSGDPRLYWSLYLGNNNWREREAVPGATSDEGPALAFDPVSSRVLLAWRGPYGDSNIYWSFFDGFAWTVPQPNPGVGSVDPPGLAFDPTTNQIYMAWRGIRDHPDLWWAQYTRQAQNWTGPQPVGDGSAHGPALATSRLVNTPVYMARRGNLDDPQIYWSQFNPQNNPAWGQNNQVWGQQSVIQTNQGIPQTSQKPALTSIKYPPAVEGELRGSILCMAWKETGDGKGIYWAHYRVDGAWVQLSPNPIPNVGTANSPALTSIVDGTQVAMAWRGVPDDEQLYWSQLHFPQTTYQAPYWDPQQAISTFQSQYGPALCEAPDSKNPT